VTDRVLTPEVFTADYVGRPGERTFFLQARGPEGSYSFVLEKIQVQALAEGAGELLLMIDQADEVRGARPQRHPDLVLQAPIEPEWRVGTIALGYEEKSDLTLVVLERAPEPGAPEPAETDKVQILLTRAQLRAFVGHALAVVAEGRPPCPLCGLPVDPDGHTCPSSNGHHPLGEG
jgi:uncharacterized repeat protein (TIGR03847 family)